MKYDVIANDATAFYAFDIALERWQAKPKMFPYDQPGALIPQDLIPKELRRNQDTLFNFYFYICLYMRGGIESAQAFRAMIKLWQDQPDLFVPEYAGRLLEEDLQPIIAKYIGWDAEAVTKFWIENSRRLMRGWNGQASNVFKGLATHEEAMWRIQNKDRKSKKMREEGSAIYGKCEGFMGFQAKMVSMIIYFIDWEGLLENGFVYPTPADFHNFRFGLALRGIVIHPQPANIRTSEKLSKVWRDLTVRYLEARKGTVTPVELADAIWLFSLDMCGNSPLTTYHEREDKNGYGLFEANDLEHSSIPDFMAPRFRGALLRTCLSCPLRDMCELAVPAAPYYQRRGHRDEAFGGQLYLTERFPIENHLPTYEVDFMPRGAEATGMNQGLLIEDLPEQLAPERPTEIPL